MFLFTRLKLTFDQILHITNIMKYLRGKTHLICFLCQEILIDKVGTFEKSKFQVKVLRSD